MKKIEFDSPEQLNAWLSASDWDTIQEADRLPDLADNIYLFEKKKTERFGAGYIIKDVFGGAITRETIQYLKNSDWDTIERDDKAAALRYFPSLYSEKYIRRFGVAPRSIKGV